MSSDQLMLGFPILLSMLICGIRLSMNVSADEKRSSARWDSQLNLCTDALVVLSQGLNAFLLVYQFIPNSSITLLLYGVFVTPVWWFLLNWVSLNAIILVAGTLLFLETVEAYRQLRFSLLNFEFRSFANRMYSKLILHTQLKPNLYLAKVSTSLNLKRSQPKVGKLYSVTVLLIENQRYFGRYGWEPPVDPDDPPAWINAKHVKAPSKTKFNLPPPVTRNLRPAMGGSEGKHVCFNWVWEDQVWTRVFTSLTDDEGWSYGNHKWSDFISQSSSLFGFKVRPTRRRIWKRQAALQRVIL